ncbi:CBBY-like protein isoform X2 [Rhododendron vialii]|uniref:CBBY-like protein isoform X2 n=1 Tax=Rhododendron vialii TaxID=182163 RepID=UPI00265E4171|nr:CBBY-like protein isoform X2 [Rhododendron vialii]
METASFRILHTLGINNRRSSKYHQSPLNHLHFPPLLSYTCRKSFNFRGNSLQFKKRFTASGSSLQQNSSQQLAVLLEVEGVLMDVYRLGNRQAFNVAFRKLGLDCANWTEPIYLDLVRKSTGDEEMMLILYFNRIGWPSSLPTSEKETFMKSVLREKKKALDDLVLSKSLPLRPGVEDFIDDACDEGIPVVILTAYSRSSDKISRSIVEKLGEHRISKIKMVGNDEVEQSFYGQLVLGKGVSSSLDEQLAKEARKAASAEKQRIAEDVASMLNLKKIVAAQRAGAEFAGVPVYNCVLVSGSQSGIAGAEHIGMPCIVLRSSLTSRAEFPSARAIMDGFGGADLTVSRLRNMS